MKYCITWHRMVFSLFGIFKPKIATKLAKRVFRDWKIKTKEMRRFRNYFFWVIRSHVMCNAMSMQLWQFLFNFIVHLESLSTIPHSPRRWIASLNDIVNRRPIKSFDSWLLHWAGCSRDEHKICGAQHIPHVFIVMIWVVGDTEQGITWQWLIDWWRWALVWFVVVADACSGSQSVSANERRDSLILLLFRKVGKSEC